MIRVIINYNGISRIIYEGYDADICHYIKQTLTTVGKKYYVDYETDETMLRATITVL